MENSKIEWTDHTFNPWIGCTKVSPGCTHCYAETLMDTRLGRVKWGARNARMLTSAANWKLPLKWNRDALLPENLECLVCGSSNSFGLNADGFCETCEIEGFPIRPRVFCASLADWLDDEVPADWLARLLELISATQNLDWLLLTKRPENWNMRMAKAQSIRVDGYSFPAAREMIDDWHAGKPPGNVWIGTSVEDQKRADERIPKLLNIPARIRFLSCEPLLGPVDIQAAINKVPWVIGGGNAEIHWVICGGESGPGSRPMQPEWARQLRDDCERADVAFLFKQWGGLDKKATGRELDGRTHDDIPENAEVTGAKDSVQ